MSRRPRRSSRSGLDNGSEGFAWIRDAQNEYGTWRRPRRRRPGPHDDRDLALASTASTDGTYRIDSLTTRGASCRPTTRGSPTASRRHAHRRPPRLHPRHRPQDPACRPGDDRTSRSPPPSRARTAGVGHDHPGPDDRSAAGRFRLHLPRATSSTSPRPAATIDEPDRPGLHRRCRALLASVRPGPDRGDPRRVPQRHAGPRRARPRLRDAEPVRQPARGPCPAATTPAMSGSPS